MSSLSNLAFDSALRVEHIALKSSIPFSVTVAAGTQTYTIPHNLGYRPYVKAFYDYGDGIRYPLFAGPGSFNIDGNGGQIHNINVDTANLVVTIDNFGASTISGTIYYRIYAEPQQ